MAAMSSSTWRGGASIAATIAANQSEIKTSRTITTGLIGDAIASAVPSASALAECQYRNDLSAQS